jgi:hypothetical protein
MPDIDPQIFSVALTFVLLITAAKSTIKEILDRSRVRTKSASKNDGDESPATPDADKKPRAIARRRSVDTYATMESHIVRSLLVVLLSFAVYKLIIAELPHREPQQQMSLSPIQSRGNPERWEYSVREKTLSESELNALGNEGWELISHKFEMESKMDTYILKRRKS